MGRKQGRKERGQKGKEGSKEERIRKDERKVDLHLSIQKKPTLGVYSSRNLVLLYKLKIILDEFLGIG